MDPRLSDPTSTRFTFNAARSGGLATNVSRKLLDPSDVQEDPQVQDAPREHCFLSTRARQVQAANISMPDQGLEMTKLGQPVEVATCRQAVPTPSEPVPGSGPERDLERWLGVLPPEEQRELKGYVDQVADRFSQAYGAPAEESDHALIEFTAVSAWSSAVTHGYTQGLRVSPSLHIRQIFGSDHEHHLARYQRAESIGREAAVKLDYLLDTIDESRYRALASTFAALS
ncbi:MAG: hypothetical protein AB1758_28625 [Candidatus Eremiobacterota bacterium]